MINLRFSLRFKLHQKTREEHPLSQSSARSSLKMISMRILCVLLCLNLAWAQDGKSSFEKEGGGVRGPRIVEHMQQSTCKYEKNWPICADDDWGTKCPSGCRIQGLIDDVDQDNSHRIDKIRQLLADNHPGAVSLPTSSHQLQEKSGIAKMSRFPVDVKAVGLMQCRKQKKYMMFVSWSDQNNILIYRTFEEFKRLHKELKRKFPIESGSLRRSDRTIPKFKDVNVKQRKMNKFLERLKLLETYSQELLKTDAKISQSEDLIQFFRAQTQDLDPCFPEDSVVIMPSEIGGEKKKQAQQQLSITNPQASQSYRCVETFETKDTKNQAFKVAQKEIVEVLLKDMTGWWLVENADKQLAWFPASYLEEIDVHEDSQDALSSDEEGSLYFVVRAYESQKADELSLHSGVVVEVVRKSDNGWWLIRYNRQTGYMPSMCLQPYKNPHHRLQTIMNCGLNVSTPNLSASPPAPQPQGKVRGGGRVQDHAAQNQSDEDVSSLRSRSRSTPDLDSDSSSLSSGSRLSWKPDLSRSLPEVEQVRSPRLGKALATHSSKSPHLTHKDRNDSGFVESSAADLSCSLSDSDTAGGVPKVPTRPSAHEILQRCSTVTRRALRQSAPQALSPLPNVH